MILKQLLRCLRRVFVRSRAYCRAHDIWDSACEPVSVLVFRACPILGRARCSYSWVATESKCRFVAMTVVRRTGEREEKQREVSLDSYYALIAALKEAGLGRLKTFHGRIRDGIVYDLALVSETERISLFMTNPQFGNCGHYGVVKVLARWVADIEGRSPGW